MEFEIFFQDEPKFSVSMFDNLQEIFDKNFFRRKDSEISILREFLIFLLPLEDHDAWIELTKPNYLEES